MKRFTSITLSLVLTTLSAWAGDLTITFNQSGSGMGVKTAGVQTQLFSSKFHRTNDEGNKVDTLVDYDTGTTYTIEHKTKKIKYYKLEDALAAMEKLGASMKELPPMVANMMGDPNQFSVDKAGKDQVAGRNCDKYKINVAKINMEMSADPSLVAPVPEAKWANMMKARGAMMSAAGPMGAAFKRLYEEMSKIKGIPLKTRMTGMMGMDSTVEATKVVEGAISPAAFELPKGYAMEDVGKKMREGKM